MAEVWTRLESALNENSRRNEQVHKLERLLSEARDKIALQESALDDLCISLNERDQTITELRIEIKRIQVAIGRR